MTEDVTQLIGKRRIVCFTEATLAPGITKLSLSSKKVTSSRLILNMHLLE